MEQYLALIKDNFRSGVVKPEIGNDIEFEINSNFIRELRCKLFKDTDDEDAHEHVQRVLEIADLFHFPGVTHDVVMLRVFPIALKGPDLRWKNRLSVGSITTWDLLKKAFIRQYYSPFKTAKKLEEIHNFKQEMDETFQQKVHIFYTGLDIHTRIMLDSKGFIPLMTPTQALKSIQLMADHLHNWYDVETIRERINDCSINVNTKKLKENIHAIQESCKVCERAHLTKECPLKKEDKAIEQGKYIGSLEETIIKYYDESIKKQAVKAGQLTQMILTNAGEKVKEKMEIGKKDMKEPVPRDFFVIQTYKAQEDERDMDDGWDITIEDVERLRQILTPTQHTFPNLKPVMQPYMPLGPVRDKEKVIKEEEHDYDISLQDGVMQPLTPQTVYITPPDDD
ncbi:calmodulin-interacting protein 111 isoform X1 [Tanacetum coccineum]